ncbi:TLD-domain containing nucleolar protein [Perilla frutescens var. hirtella]|nr:TLD-domain containing nucleolar protein [Perilla frutescens var. hirtella]KAH6807481.1 TLD-domain containing nucleolar protein [Perilla frutescens var. frutescens]
MGNSESSSADPRYVAAARAFSQTELDDLRSLYTSLAAQCGSNGKYVSPGVFKAYIGIDGPLGDRVFDLVSQKRKDQRLTFEDLVVAKGTYEKGTNREIEEFIYQILDVSDDGTVGRSDLEAVLTSIFNNLFHQQCSDGKQIEVFINAANPTSDSMSFEDFQKWCAHLPAVRKYLGSLLTPSDSGSHVPKLLMPDNIDPGQILLTKEYAWHIGGALSDTDEWKLLYHSGVHGLSFNTFLGHMIKAPTLLVIKDKEGYIYGGYASQPWERHPDFYGDMRSFLFQLNPKASIFRPTGANHNLQWCAVSFSSESIPNGIGFGGKANHFGVFVSANFDQGHSFGCTTFGSPSLSKVCQIYPETIECWGVVPRADDDRPEALKGTVLDRFKEDRHMLNMVGLANSSQ